jgi:hypothetical protein
MDSLRNFQYLLLPACGNHSIAEQANCLDYSGIGFVGELNESGERYEY